MVLGHQKCGAVNAAVDLYPKPAAHFVSAIYDAVAKVREREPDANEKTAVSDAIDQHVMLEVQKLSLEVPSHSTKRSPLASFA